MQTPALVCDECGMVLSAAGGRCPGCGANQPDGHQAPPEPPRQQYIAGVIDEKVEPEPKSNMTPLAIGGGVIALVLIGLATVALMNSKEEQVAEVAPLPTVLEAPKKVEPKGPDDIGIKDLAAVDLDLIWGGAHSRALRWNRDAVLVSVEASPVVASKVDAKGGGTVHFVYGTPTGEGFGTGARVQREQFQVSVGPEGSTSSTITAAKKGRAVLDPNCPFSEATRKLIGAGIIDGLPFSVKLVLSEKFKRPVWEGKTLGDDPIVKTLDASTCTILIR
ncbi:MAG: hypothetical protein HRU17_13965 [Polyangiaceae bacterium]|nr:hypothetical protein [Polyangiaceae bacterium]